MPETLTTPAENPLDDVEADIGLHAGDTLGGRYEVVRVIGAGGMGAVFEAKHRTIGKVVAIKVLRREVANDKQLAARFLQEARAATEVRHRNIVEISDFGDDGGRLYMVMEFLRGESLSRMMERTAPMSPADILTVMIPVLRALGAAHDRGIVHRDIKPDNIFLALEDDSTTPTPKILDFGIAKRAVSDDIRLTNTRTSFGTPAYMAPEQAMGARDVTAAADQYAIGVILYEALAGALPHRADSYNAVIIAKVNSVPPDLASVRADLDPALCTTVMRALERDPAARFASVHALREALERFADVNSLPPRGPRSTVPRDAQRDAQSDAMLGATLRADSMDKLSPQTPSQWTTGQQAAGPDRRRVQRVVRIVAAVLVAILVVRYGIRANRRSPPIPAVVAVTAIVPSVAFHVRVEPSAAQIWFDDHLIGTGSAELSAPHDGRPHHLHLEAPGFASVDDTLTADADARIDRSLVAVAVPETPASDAAVAPRAAPSTPAAPRAHPASDGDGRHPHMDRHIQF